jgi:hypothetical protein
MPQHDGCDSQHHDPDVDGLEHSVPTVWRHTEQALDPVHEEPPSPHHSCIADKYEMP